MLMREEPIGGHKRTENEGKSLPRTKVEEEVLEHELMRIMVGLDPLIHPKEKREAIETAYVIKGLLQVCGTQRISVPDNPSTAGPGLYTSLFERLRRTAADAHPDAPAAPQQRRVYELFPKPQAKVVPPDTPLPSAGESIDETPPDAESDSRVKTIDLG